MRKGLQLTEMRKDRVKKTRRLQRALAIMLRALVALLALQLSGLPHALDDLADAVVAEAGISRHTDCNGQDPDDADCPPGCPSCHCVHPNVLPPALNADLFGWSGAGDQLADLLYDANAPPQPQLPHVFRPPRAAV